MKAYDPLSAPLSEDWLGLDETERIRLVREYHRRTGQEIPGEKLHAVIHVTVENQVLLGDETPVAGTLQRLMDEGLDRHEAIHAIGGVLIEHMWDVLKSKGKADISNEAYFDSLRSLTAQSWLDQFR
ncbi:MAG: DUF1841 family protein [Fidelibacterota bacterium]